MIYIVGHQQVENLDKLNKNYTYLNTTELCKTNPDDIILQCHKFLNEWIAQYYIRNYTQLDDNEIYGFCHYRRVFDYQDIQYNSIINDNKVQMFQHCIHFMPKPVYLTLKIDKIQDYQLVYVYIVKQLGSLPMYNFFVEYMNTFPLDIQNKWKEKTKFYGVEKPGRIDSTPYCPFKPCPSREIFVMNKQNLIEMTDFLTGYVKYIFQKLEINSLNKANLIFYNVYSYNLVDQNSIDDHYRWFCSRESRLIAYILELLVGLYIYVNYETIYKSIWPNNFMNSMTEFMD